MWAFGGRSAAPQASAPPGAPAVPFHGSDITTQVCSLLYGEATQRDIPAGIAQLRRIVERPLAHLALYHLYGYHGVRYDREMGRSLLHYAAANGEPCARLLWYRFKGGASPPEDEMRMLRDTLAAVESEATRKGGMYESDPLPLFAVAVFQLDTNFNRASALKYLRSCVERGFAPAMSELASQLLEVGESKDEAERLLRDAAARCDPFPSPHQSPSPA